ncbi:MAG: cadherin-like domain-containing protein, partial [Actinobacteria bacterium]|nr:cadherin-like domain-containing protein [Actinomycetota bacterium]
MGASGATVSLGNDGSFLLTPTSANGGGIWFQYKLCNPAGCSIAKANISQTGPGQQPSGPSTPPVAVNQAPNAVTDSFNATAGEALVIPAAQGLLANDSDAENDPLTVKSLSTFGQGLTPHGVVNSWNADGSISYTPNAGWHGTDQINYVLSDGNHEVTGAVTWVVTEPSNYAPTALRDEASVRSGTSLLLPLGGVLANDTDLDGDTLTVTGHTAPAHGTATIAGNGEVRYAPSAGFTGQDELDYTVSDGTETATGTLVIDVTAADAPAAPIALGDRYRTDPRNGMNDVLIVSAPGLLRNDFSPGGAPLTVTTSADSAHGTVAMQPDGSFTYTPAQNFTGTASFE